ncbi:MAG: hypothetical protein KZQ82_21215 [Candidatus Thiodiazotropha sp. (ex Lucinoma annulata)]|nr:hypothetical protein [Candidatus Thiodiazotropha sp. (ex Lucinoma annulata)]
MSVSKAKQPTEIEQFNDLLIDYGNAMFDCGEHSGSPRSEYHQLTQRSEELREQLIQQYEGLTIASNEE